MKIFHLKPLLACCLTFLIAGQAVAVCSEATQAYQAGMLRMHSAMDITYSGQVDSDFARGMKPHHEGAVDMADVELRYGHDAEMRSMAAWIRVAQEGEIGEMANWIDRRAAEPPYGRAEKPGAVTAFREGMHAMHRAMNITYSGDADRDFVCGMIPHHQGAVDMARIEVSEGRDPDMLKLAGGIIRSQGGEIAVMRRWLRRHRIICEQSAEAMSGMHHSQ